MQQMTLTPEFVNPPKAGGKFASIKANGVYYGFPQDMLPSFQKGVPVTVDVEQNGQYWNIKRVYGSIPATPAEAAAMQRAVNPAPIGHNSGNGNGGERYEPRKQEDIFVCGVVNSAIAHQSYPLDQNALATLIASARTAWKNNVPF